MSTLTVDAHAQSSSAFERPAAGSMVLLGSARRFAPAVDGWFFRGPLPVRLEREEDGTVVAVDAYFGNYGQGQSWDAAIEDLTVVLTEYFTLMEGCEDAPSRQVFADLRSYLDRIQ